MVGAEGRGARGGEAIAGAGGVLAGGTAGDAPMVHALLVRISPAFIGGLIEDAVVSVADGLHLLG